MKIKKKDHDNLTQAARYLERAQMLLERAQYSSPVISFVGQIKETTNDLEAMSKQLNIDIQEFTH
ncbi:hypothetical protein [Pedobacter duraquae]|uniref:Uncharacterized protein n=1 Tax=Pedobacter duraquae TaxID=425511 RepID=A0A4R6IIV8_9SPHI|nr:hypothetical protein [Pedobacter duraquae]TDO21907.1 hypothetical protein CLV32_3015 [Pedobacter duraquae]